MRLSDGAGSSPAKFSDHAPPFRICCDGIMQPNAAEALPLICPRQGHLQRVYCTLWRLFLRV